MKIERDFYLRTLDEQEWIIENNYCNNCKVPDTGINNPIEYELNGKIYVDGFCNVCGSLCQTEITSSK